MGFGKGSYSFLYLDVHHIMTKQTTNKMAIPDRWSSLLGLLMQTRKFLAFQYGFNAG